MKEKKIYLLFDGRYRTDEDSATMYESCTTLKEAKETAKDYGDDTVIVLAIEYGEKYIELKSIIN